MPLSPSSVTLLFLILNRFRPLAMLVRQQIPKSGEEGWQESLSRRPAANGGGSYIGSRVDRSVCQLHQDVHGEREPSSFLVSTPRPAPQCLPIDAVVTLIVASRGFSHPDVTSTPRQTAIYTTIGQKINAKNSWSLNLIDYISDVLDTRHGEMTNFQVGLFRWATSTVPTQPYLQLAPP